MSALQDFLAEGAAKAASDLEAALMRLPEEKRNWSAGGSARSALDMVAEVAILNGTTADTIESRGYPADFDWAVYARRKQELANDWPALKSLLDESTARVAQVIRAIADEDMCVQAAMPWGPMTLTQLASYPFWNGCYHEGQINFIASMLGCME